MSEQRAKYLRFRRKLLAGYLILCALLFSLLAWKIESGYASDRAAAVALTGHSAGAMAAHVNELIDAVDQPLRVSALAIGASTSGTMTPKSIQSLLAASPLSSDSRFWLLFIDASGMGVVASSGLAVGGVSYADRSYFRDPARARTDQLHIGGSADGRVSGRQLFFLSRRVESSSGEFLGVVAAPIDAWPIANVFENARIGPAMSIALTTRDHVIIARAPNFEESFGADLSDLELTIPAWRSSGEFEATSPFDDEKRLFSYAPVGALPLVVVVGVTRDSWIARFRSDLAAGLVGLAVALLVALFSGKFALDQYGRLVQVEAWQRILIAELGTAKERFVYGERRLRIIADNVPAQVAYINVDERYTFHNAGDHGAPRGARMGKTLLEAHGPEIYALLKGDICEALLGNRVDVERAYEIKGMLRYFKHQYTPDITASGRVMGFYAMITDITEFKTTQNRLAALARVDTLTALPNRAALIERLEAALARCRRTGGFLACLYLDIDRFKEVNDTLGHSGGDCALIEFARRLRQCVRESDIVARLGGDEFVIILEDLDQPAEAGSVAAKIVACMEIPFNIEGNRRVVTTSVGIIIGNAIEDNSASLLRAADDALYRAKRAGRNRIES